jgi:pyruvate/2-oxoglutarate/acetoin dehydrogenase E1 component|tara:strand:- start:400 stop:1308 length:909 start_codon:yes stop_codon:yes gene_type:complete
MGKTLKETIKEIIRKHLKNKKGKVFGQCLTAVGWVGGTLPELYEKDGMIELSMADVAGGGIVTGSALMREKPIYVIRYQGFNWYNAPMIVNYAAKSKEIWNTPCPVFVRGIGMEGGIGPVAGSSHHSLYYRMPGLKIVSPMTPKEYKKIYNSFMKDDEVYYVSEHRGSFNNKIELKDDIKGIKDFVIIAISITRFEAIKAKEILEKRGLKIGIINILWIKPLKISKASIKCIANSKFGAILLDDDYVDGISNSLANKLSHMTDKKIFTLGLSDKSAGFHKKVDNLPPSSSQIIKKIISLTKN